LIQIKYSPRLKHKDLKRIATRGKAA